jgi:hypothetical protein
MAVNWNGIAPKSVKAIIALDGVIVNGSYIVRWYDGNTPITANVTLHDVRRTYARWTDGDNVMHVAERGHYYRMAVQNQVKYCPLDIYYTADYANMVGTSFIRSTIEGIIATANTAYTTIEVVIGSVFQEYSRAPDTILNVLAAFRQETAGTTVCGAVLFDAAAYTPIVGLAYVGTACTANGRAIVSLPANVQFIQALVFAHEMGHVFNAEHVEQYPDCSTEQTIMQSTISQSTRMEFSTCTASVIDDFADTCLTNITRPDPPPTLSVADTWTIVAVCILVSLFIIGIIWSQCRRSGQHAAAKQLDSQHAYHTSAVNVLPTGLPITHYTVQL